MTDKKDQVQQQNYKSAYRPGEYKKYLKAYMGWLEVRRMEIKAENKRKSQGRKRGR